MPQVVPFIPLIASAASAAGSGVMAHQQNVAQNKATREARQVYAATAFPNAANVEATELQNRGLEAQARFNAQKTLPTLAGAKNIGAGSGAITKGYSDIDTQYFKGISERFLALNKYKNTPMFPPPSNVYGQAQVNPWATGITQGISGISSNMGQAKGMYDMQNIMQGKEQSYLDFLFPKSS